jgi:hypothetical protein
VQYLNIRTEPKLLDDMLALNGADRRVPTIVLDGKVTVGFGGT